MIRPPVRIDRRRGRAAEPPHTAAGGATTSSSSSKPKAGSGSGGKPAECRAALGQAQLRLEGLRQQLSEWAAGPVVKGAVARRGVLQEKREQFLGLLQQLLAAKEEGATQRVWLHSERERAEEARGQLLDARLMAVQHQRRIRELLLRTDPQLAPGDLKAGVAQLGREAHVATVRAVHEVVLQQREGYAALQGEYAQALRAEARARNRDIQWAAALLPKLLDGVAALARQSDAFRAQVLGRFLRRRHHSQRQKALLEATKAACLPARLKWEGESLALENRFKQEQDMLRGEAAAARERRVTALRRQVAAKQAELGELDAWYNHLLDTFEDRCKELEELARHAKAEAEEWAGMRAEARVFFQTNLQEVRMRLRAWELQREREDELLGAQGLWEAVEGMGDLDAGLEEEEGSGGGEEGEESDMY